MQRVAFAVAISFSLVACAELEKSMNDLSKPIKGPSINAPNNNVSVNVGSNGASGAQPASASDGGAGSAQPPAGQPVQNVVTGTCEGSCNHYLGCKNVTDAAYKAECIKGCVALKRPAADLAQFEAMDCATAIATVEKPAQAQAGAPAGAPTTARGNGTCPAPLATPRSAEDEKVFQASTTRPFCGFTYNKTTGTSREMVLRFLPDGTMVHQTKTERSANTNAGSYGMVTSAGDRYCWKYGAGVMTWSSDGANYTQFVTKVEDNGNGVVFVTTKLGEYKACQ